MLKFLKHSKKRKQIKKKQKKKELTKIKTRQEILVKSDFNKNFIFASFKQKKKKKS